MKKNNFLKILILIALVFCGYLIFVNGCDFNSPGISGGGLIDNPTDDNSLSNLFEFKESEDFIKLTSDPGVDISGHILLVNPAMEIGSSDKFNSLERYEIAHCINTEQSIFFEFDYYNGSEEEVWPHIMLDFCTTDSDTTALSVDLVISSDNDTYTYLPYFVFPDNDEIILQDFCDDYFFENLNDYFLISTKPLVEFEELINFDEDDNRFESIYTPNLNMSGKLIYFKSCEDEELLNEVSQCIKNVGHTLEDCFIYDISGYGRYSFSVTDVPFFRLNVINGDYSFVSTTLMDDFLVLDFDLSKLTIGDDFLIEVIKKFIDETVYVSKESIYLTGKWQPAVLDELPDEDESSEEHIFNEDDSTTYELLKCNSKDTFIPSLTLASTSGKNEYVSIHWKDGYIGTYDVSPSGTICDAPFYFEKNCNYTILLENTDYYKITDVCDNWSDVGLTEADFNQYRLDLNKSFFHGYLNSVDLGVVNDNISCFTIGKDLFSYSDKLETLIIPDGITKISAYAFYCLNNLKEIVIPASVLELEKNFFTVTENNLISLVVEAGNKNYDSRNDCNAIIETNSNTLILGSNNTIIPEGVLKIAHSAFSSCMFESIIIPSSVKEIANQAFYDCSNLSSIYLNSSEIVSIADNSFDSPVEEIVVPANLYDAYYASAQWANYKDILVRGSE